MAVFTAVATSIVAAVGITGTAALIATSVIAAGLAYGTAKLFGVFEPPKSGKDPGVKIQLPPATDNKVPRMYGKNYSGGIIVDAEIKNSNKTMAYAIVISEHNPTDVWSINKIYRGDSQLVFGTGGDAHKVKSLIDPNATSNTKVTDKLRCRVYAGGSAAANQIFPTTNQTNAYDMFANWTAANTMEGLVFAVFEIDYDPEEGLTGLDAITFDIENDLTNPADVLKDYLYSDRYGAGLSNVFVDEDSLTNWASYCDDQIDFIAPSGSSSHERYRIDGALSMFDTVKTNINKICQSGSGWFTFNNKTGKFGIVVNRAATAGEKQTAFVFNDNNVISSLAITSTELFSLFNAIEVEYPSYAQRDQTDIYYAEVPAEIQNPLEPYNKLDYRLDLVNDKTRVASLANVDINQSRLSTVIDFTADYAAIQLDVGDVVKFSSQLYGYNDRLFRAMRLVEQESDEGVITVRVTLLEYSDEIYSDILTAEDLPPPVNGIPNFYVNQEVRDASNTSTANSAVSGFVEQQIPANVIVGLDGNFTDLYANLAILEADIIELETVTLPALQDELDASAANITLAFIEIDDLNSNVLPALNVALQANTDAIGDLNTIIIPQLESDLANTNSNISVLTTVTLPALNDDLNQLENDLANNTANISTLNTVTIPALNTELIELENSLANVSGNVTADLSQLESDLANIEGLFPITETSIAANAITTPKLAANSVTAEKIVALTITGDKLVANTITGNKIAANTIAASSIIAGSITATQIAASTITATQIAASTITGNQIAASTITGNKIAANTITASNILAGTITADKIAAGVITAPVIEAGSITANELATNSVTAIKILAGSVTATKIATNAVTADKILANSVTAVKIATDAVTANKIQAGAITTGKIDANAVTTDKLAANSVTANQIAAGSIIASKLAASELITLQAQMGTAVIGTAAINNAAVNTLKIAGEAVFVPRFATESVGPFTLDSIETTVVSGSFTISGLGVGQTARIIITVHQQCYSSTSTATNLEQRIRLNGNEISLIRATFDGRGMTVANVGTGLYPNGTYDLTVTVRADQNPNGAASKGGCSFLTRMVTISGKR